MDITPSSFSALYRTQFGFVWASLGRLGVPSASVEDALQDVFVVAHRRLPGFEARSGVRTWLFGIARRVAFRYRRSASRSDRKHRAAHGSAHTTMPSLAGGSAPDPDEVVARRQVGALVLRALDELDDDKRAAVVLHVFDELSGPQVADMLGLKVDTAYSRIKAGRRALRTRLVAMGVREDHPGALAAARQQTQAAKGARRRVAVLLSARLGQELGTGAAAVASVGAWKGVAAALALGVAGIAGVQAVSPPPKTVDGLTRGLAPGASNPERAAAATPVAATARTRTEAVSVVRGPAPPRPQAGPEPAPRSGAGPERASAAAAVRLGRAATQADATPPTQTAADRLSEEVGLIEAARGALDRGQSEGALRLLAEHAQRFADGQLVAERAAYRAIALCAAGRTAQGRGEARLFLERHPQAMLLARLRRACALPQ